MPRSKGNVAKKRAIQAVGGKEDWSINTGNHKRQCARFKGGICGGTVRPDKNWQDTAAPPKIPYWHFTCWVCNEKKEDGTSARQKIQRRKQTNPQIQ